MHVLVEIPKAVLYWETTRALPLMGLRSHCDGEF